MEREINEVERNKVGEGERGKSKREKGSERAGRDIMWKRKIRYLHVHLPRR